MKILVTGASGNVGTYVVKELLKLGEKIIAAGTDTKKLKNMFGDTVDIVEFDFTNKDTFNDALNNVDRVFLMRPPNLGRPHDLYPFIDGMKSRNIKLISFLSLMGVENNIIPPHHKIEKYIEASGVPYAHIRPGFFMQNVSGIHSVEIRGKDKIFVPAGKSKISFIDASDIGLSIAIILHDPEKYRNTAHTITGPAALDYNQVAAVLSKITGRKITYDKPGYLKYRNYYIKTRKLNKNYVNVTVMLYFMTRLGTAKEVTDEFYKITGKKPRTFEDFAKGNIEAFMK